MASASSSWCRSIRRTSSFTARAPRFRPNAVATGGVGESTEGRIVRVVGTITQAPAIDDIYGYKFYVDDGSGELTIFVNTQTGIDLSGLAVGQIVSVTGFSSQFDTHYEIDPRTSGPRATRQVIEVHAAAQSMGGREVPLRWLSR